VSVVAAARLTLLDGFVLETPNSPADGEELPHAVQRLVALLCLSVRLPRATVAGRLWPEVPEEQAHGSLRSALWRLHKQVPHLVEVTGHSLAVADGVQVDVRELDRWSRRLRNPQCGEDELEVPDVVLRGELLPGWYDDWVLVDRERLRQLRMHALECAAERLMAIGRYAEALEAAYAAVRCEPLRESSHRAVVRTHLAEGNLAEAFRAFRSYQTMLADELGVAPSEHMARLLQGIRRAP
jgi:DNA-binding SARP family transcriptional activator